MSKKKFVQNKKVNSKQIEKRKDSYSFFENVYEVTRLIPRGRVTSYGAIAKYLGSGQSARMVGYAMNAAHIQIPPVPAHRVLNRNGMLTGKHHFGSPDLMQKMLEKEGVKVSKDTVEKFDKIFWNPAIELSI
ncbi:MAG: MGMT family protein [Bacteroidetes bacterium]|nr:MGMT family protein [Bacteroidota bacterium]